MKVWNILNESFPYYLNDDRKNTLLVAGLSLFVVVFLITFHPMHLEHIKKISLIGLVTFAMMYGNIVLLPRLLPGLFDAVNWTIGKYILFTIWQLAIIGAVGSTALYATGFYPDKNVWEISRRFYPNMIMYGSITIILVTIVLRNAMLRDNLRNAIHANQELEKIRNLKQSVQINESVSYITIYSDTSETVKLHLPDLLYVEASDNYSTLYWKNGNGVAKKLLRVNLKNIETQLNNSYTIRCHRSFIVNINAITHVRGNANGYKLSVRDTEFTVPVSRTKGQEVIEKIRQIRNLVESA